VFLLREKNLLDNSEALSVLSKNQRKEKKELKRYSNLFLACEQAQWWGNITREKKIG